VHRKLLLIMGHVVQFCFLPELLLSLHQGAATGVRQFRGEYCGHFLVVESQRDKLAYRR
jgi:hypothetical protein